MADFDLQQASLLLVGHGSSKNSESSLPAYQHAATLRSRNCFREVLVGFWQQEPSIRGVLNSVGAGPLFVVPLFISSGYFTDEVIPRELGLIECDGGALPPGVSSARRGRRGDVEIIYTEPVGGHSLMTEVLLARAREVVLQHPFPFAPCTADISLFLAGHGTGRNENSRRAVEAQADMIRHRALYASVEAVFMEESPRIADCCARATTKNVVVVPFFISDGLHVQEDIPILLGESEKVVRERLSARQPTWRNPTEKHGRRIWYSSAVGTEPGLAEVILERVRDQIRLMPAR